LFPLKDNIPTERFPVVTVALIAINVIVYFFLQDGFLGLPNDGAGGDWTVTARRTATSRCPASTKGRS
jgi:hypothetical protein